MGRKRRKNTNWTRDGTAAAGSTGIPANSKSILGLWLQDADLSAGGYTRLSDNPEIQTAVLRIAELIASMTIYLMENTEDGDLRIRNELARLVDISPNGNMSRAQWMTVLVANTLLYGSGNGICVPHTRDGYLESLEPISPNRVSFRSVGNSYREYRVLIDGIPHDPAELMHFVYNPDPIYPWKGRGVTVTLKDIANNLKQAQKTENAFMASEWKPSIIVKVDALTEEFSSPEGRQKLLDSYAKPARTGEPWLIPAEQFQVEQVRPLSLADLAIKDTVELDKRTVASVVGVPPFLLGVGKFDKAEWNNFVQTKVKYIAQTIQQELTRCLLISPKWYFTFNVRSLLSYDLKTMSDIMLQGSDRGFVCGDEWRDAMYLPPAGQKEYRVLENYIPNDMSGDQKKLIQGGENDGED